MLGLGSGIGKSSSSDATIITDNLVLRHQYVLNPVKPLSDGAASFDGTDDYIDTNATFQSTFRDSFSISMWIKVIDGQTSEHTILGTIKSSADGVRVDILSGGELRFVFEGENDDSYITTSAVVFSDGPSDWTHILCTATKGGSGNTALVIYVNGVAMSYGQSGYTTVENHALYTSDINLIIGGRMNDASSERFFNGYICNVGIWSAALTQPQVKSIMNKNYADLIASEKTDLVSWWNLDSVIDSADSGDGDTVVYDNHHGGGEILGSELVTNGDFSNGTTDWSKSSEATLSVTDNQLDIQSLGASGEYGYAFSTVNFTSGKTYLISLDVISTNNASQIRAGKTSSLESNPTNIWDSGDIGLGSHSIIYTAGSSATYFGIGGRNDVTTLVIDNVSVKEINGNTGTLS